MLNFFTLLFLLASIQNSVESSSRRGNDWIPSCPENNEVLTADELASLLSVLNSAEDSYAEDIEHHTSVPSNSSKHTDQGHQSVPRRYGLGTQSELLPTEYASSSSPRLKQSSSSEVNSPKRNFSRVKLPSSGRSNPSADTPLRSRSRSPRARSRSPRARQIFSRISGFKVEEIGFIRLSPHHNWNRVFEIRKYAFPPDTPLRLMNSNRLCRIPAVPMLVLSTSTGDAFAILYKKANQSTLIRGIYVPVGFGSKRVKINMASGEIKELNASEIRDCPLTPSIKKWFNVYRV